jgi:hypothetical protein
MILASMVPNAKNVFFVNLEIYIVQKVDWDQFMISKLVIIFTLDLANEVGG